MYNQIKHVSCNIHNEDIITLLDDTTITISIGCIAHNGIGIIRPDPKDRTNAKQMYNEIKDKDCWTLLEGTSNIAKHQWITDADIIILKDSTNLIITPNRIVLSTVRNPQVLLRKVPTISVDIDYIVSEGVSDMFAKIQDIIGVHEGDLASHFYVDKQDDIEPPLQAMFKEYIRQELGDI